MPVSIHAPARGATTISSRFVFIASGFNPRPRTGGDDTIPPEELAAAAVSIHAPARGATHFKINLEAPYDGFNPRPRTGGDQSSPPRPHRRCWFQSTPPHGGRR